MSIKKDVTQIHRSEHDEKSNARRVKMIDTELSIELDHNDGDSVTTHPDKLSISSLGVAPSDEEVIPTMPCSSLKRVKVYIEVVSGMKDCDLSLEVSPVDSGDIWFKQVSILGNSLTCDVQDICARRLRLVKRNDQGNAEMNIHLVGQG